MSKSKHQIPTFDDFSSMSSFPANTHAHTHTHTQTLSLPVPLSDELMWPVFPLASALLGCSPNAGSPASSNCSALFVISPEALAELATGHHANS